MKKSYRTTGNLAVKPEIKKHNGDRDVKDTFIANAQRLGENRYCTNLPAAMLMLPDYQRGEKGKVGKIASEWNDNQLDPLTISYRAGEFWIVDGRQRWTAATKCGKVTLPAIILTGLTIEEEVYLYTHQKSNDTRMGTYDTMFADASLGRDPAKTIFDVCKRNRVEINTGYRGRQGILSCLSTVLAIFKRSGEDGLDWVLKTIRALHWEDSKNGYSSHVLSALGNVYDNHSEDSENATRKIVRMCVAPEGRTPNTPDKIKAVAMVDHPGCGPVVALTSFFERCI